MVNLITGLANASDDCLDKVQGTNFSAVASFVPMRSSNIELDDESDISWMYEQIDSQLDIIGRMPSYE